MHGLKLMQTGDTVTVGETMRPPVSPGPGPGEVAVDMLLSPINPADLLTIDGRYARPVAAGEWLGAEGVGRVTAVGPGVVRLRVGERVLPLDRGNWVRRRICRQERLARVPEGIDDADAARLRINPATAARLLESAALPPGSVIVQNAARASVARWVACLAVEAGHRVLNVARSPEPGWIADDERLTQAVLHATHGAGAALALDAVAGVATGRLAAALQPGGRVIVFGHLSGAPSTIPSTVLTGRLVTVGGFSLRAAEAAAGESIETIDRLYAQLAWLNGVAAQSAVRCFPLTRWQEAIAAARTARGAVRILLDLAG